MKKVISLFAGILLIASLGYSAELISSGNMEAWSTGLPTGWTNIQVDGSGTASATPAATITQEATDIHGGTSSVKITRAASSWTYRYCLHSNSFTIPSSGDVSYSFWMKRVPSSTNCRIYIATSADAGTTWVADMAKVAQASADGWQNLTGTWSLTAGTLYRLTVHDINVGDMYLDDISLTTASVPVELSDFMAE